MLDWDNKVIFLPEIVVNLYENEDWKENVSVSLINEATASDLKL